MLQIPNIVRKPVIWLPPIIASAILGPISTVIIRMESNSVGAGMGTSGLVGQFGTFAAMTDSFSTNMILMRIAILHFVLPAVITLAISEFMRRRGWITFGDMRLDK